MRTRTELVLGAVLLSPFAIALALVAGPAPNLADLTRDMAATAGVDPWVGFLSFVGILYWTAAAAICLFGASLVRVRGDRRFLCVFGGLLALLGVDDLFMLHELVLPGLGVPESVVKAAYAVALLAFVICVRRRFGRVEVLIGAGALVGLGLSFVIDAFTHGGNLSSAVEDTLKFVGIVLVLVLAALVTRRLVRSGGVTCSESRESPPPAEAGRGALPPGRDAATA